MAERVTVSEVDTVTDGEMVTLLTVGRGYEATDATTHQATTAVRRY